MRIHIDMSSSFIFQLYNHRKLGFLFSAGVLGKDLISVNDFHMKGPDYFAASDKESAESAGKIATWAEECSDRDLCVRFSKKKNAFEFVRDLDDNLLKDHVRPFLDRQINKAIDIARKSGMELYFRPDRLEGSTMILLECEDQLAVPNFYFEKNDEGILYRLQIMLGEEVIPLEMKKTTIISFNPCRILYQNKIISLPKEFDGLKLKPFQNKDFIQIPLATEKRYLETFVMKNVKSGIVHAQGFKITDLVFKPVIELSPEYDWQGNAVLIVWFHYGNRRIMAGKAQKSFVDMDYSGEQCEFTRVNRDFKVEAGLWDLLISSGLRRKNENTLVVDEPQFADLPGMYRLISWINRNINTLKDNEINILQPENENIYFFGEVKSDIRLDVKTDWFDIYGEVIFGSFSFPFLSLRKNLSEGQRELILPDGQIAIIPEEWFSTYSALFRFGNDFKSKLRVKKIHFMLLDEAAFPGIPDVASFQKIDFSQAEPLQMPDKLRAELRQYQKEGLHWLQFQQKSGFGGCLADDMGLGKTVQTLAMLLGKPRDKEKASLLVMPASLIHNWVNEIRKFAPSLRYLIHTGPDRHTGDGMFDAFDLILTTYGTLRNDIDWLKNYMFYYAVLDESQFIKNPVAKSTQAAFMVKADHRLTLTGTPVENSLTDLWSQMNFLNPGLLGTLPFFQKEISGFRQTDNENKKQEELKRLVSPFILRRMKEEVAPELPELTQQIVYCEMEEEQRKQYETEKSAARNALIESIDNQSYTQNKIHILKALTRLRQLANNPVLLDSDYSGGSGKSSDILMQLETLIAGKHKTLIFSSFVKHLHVFARECDAQGWKYSMLTGATTNREKVIQEFRDNEDISVFLISLKAGGTGLNLTEADYVFLLDPWWNPAAERQAISRAHRIGQDKSVFAYKYITRDTVEERILQLQEKKLHLADTFIQTGNPLKDLNEEESLWLFS